MSDLMSSAINLMLVGMGFVFLFLIILVFVTSIMSKLIIRFTPESPGLSVAPPSALGGIEDQKSQVSVDSQLMAVFTAAVAKYRSQHKK